MSTLLPRIPRLILSVLATAFLATGCANRNRPLSELPAHDLDLSGAPPSARTSQQPPAREAYRPPEPLRDAFPWAVAHPKQWRYIVVHHSATWEGNADMFDAQHRRRGWDGLGYDFVIDNGHGGPDGRVEVGPRWRAQKVGAHTGNTPGNEYNEYGIGICLVGDFTKGKPTAAQLSALNRLVSYLADEYQIPPENVIGHRDAPRATTKCPGDSLERYVRRTLRETVRARYAMGR